MNYGKRGVRAKQRALNSKTKKLGRKLILTLVKLALASVIGIVICAVCAGLGAYKGILASTPQIHLSDVVATGEATIVYDCEGNEIDQYVSMNSNRIQINSMDLIPKHLGNAFVALEDERFYKHNGVDFEGIVRSAVHFIQSLGKDKEGASTITQQLLKNTIFTTWTEENGNMIKMFKRKFQEQYLALAISEKFTKEEVLLRYMNAINLGQNTLGVESASQRYFGKSCSDLTLSECAVIASITQNPTGLDPIRFPESNAKRRLDCLNKMLELEFITDAEYEEAIADTQAVYNRIELHDLDVQTAVNTTAGSYFSDAVYEQVREDLINIAGYSESMAETLLTSGGLRIESTMDPTIQTICDEEFSNPENFPENVYWYLNYALTVYGADDQQYNFSKENMMTWFKDNLDKGFNLIFSSQDAAYEAIATYRSAVLADLGIADREDNYLETISMTAQPQAAMTIQDQSTGYVVAIVGGRGTKEGRRTLNRATDAKRSPGSTFKVLAAFAPALDSAGQTLATPYLDAPFNFSDGTPCRNWYSGYRGINSIRDGIRESLNIVAAKTETVITPQLGYDYLVNFGFTTLTDGVWLRDSTGEERFYTDVNQTLALGGLTYGATPLELTAGYAAIANMGAYIEPKLYTRVTNTDGDILLDNTNPTSRQVIKETTAFLLTDAMVDVIRGAGGTGTSCNFSSTMAIAGKTGTSTDYNDVWFAGFTPYYTCSVWSGYDNNVHMRTERPGREVDLSKTLWTVIMKRVHENLPDEKFTTPQGIVRAEVCTMSGLQPIPGVCTTTRGEYFAAGTAPTDPCNIHYVGDVCNYDLLPASPECPMKVPGNLDLPFQEDPSLLQGSAAITPDGETADGSNSPHCQHDAAFFANPDYEAILAQQAWEITERDLAAQQEALQDPGIDPNAQ
nr:transglycosylase domain-containing protein [uncultured Acetatifactor sp.]